MSQELFEAVKAGNLDEVRRLVAETPALAGARDANGVSGILLALYHGKREAAAALVETGAPVDIFEASALGMVDRIGALLDEEPARASAYAADGFYPLGLAAFFGQLEAVRALLARGADVHAAARNAFKVQPVHAAAASRNLDILRAVLEAGGDPNVPQQQGFVPLHEAATSGNREMAELLVKYGANPRLANDAGKSSIDLATDKGHPELAAWLTGG
ncbi:MAG: ankyrin repeat domain-containing protein [Vicinamibacterales bacterium]